MYTLISSSLNNKESAAAFQGHDEIVALEEREETRLNAAKKQFEEEELKIRVSEEEKRIRAEQIAKDEARVLLQAYTNEKIPAIVAAHEEAAQKECVILQKAFDVRGEKAVESLVDAIVSSSLFTQS